MLLFFENSIIQRKITTFAPLYKTCPAFSGWDVI